MKFKNYIFDVDGTLLDTSLGIKEAILHTINVLKLHSLTEDELSSFIGPPAQKTFQKLYKLSDVESQKAADIFRDYYKEKSLLKAVPYNHIFDCMKSLIDKGCRVAIATYKREDYAIKLLKYFGFDKFTNSMHGGDNFNKISKSEIIELCMKEIGAKKEDTVYVGDTQNDYESATKIGINFIGVTYGFGFKKSEKYEFVTADNCKEIASI